MRYSNSLLREQFLIFKNEFEELNSSFPQNVKSDTNLFLPKRHQLIFWLVPGVLIVDICVCSGHQKYEKSQSHFGNNNNRPRK